MLCDWLDSMQLVSAGASATIDRYLGNYEPYATSHDALDRDGALREEASNAAASLVEAVRLIRRGDFQRPDEGLDSPRQK
jgi:hypothetical protein